MTSSITRHSDAPRREGRPVDEAAVDLQTVLTRAVARLAEATGCPRVAAWGQRPDGTPFVVAATPDAAGPWHPDAPAFEALVRLGAPCDLGGQAPPEVLRAGFSAAAPLGESGVGAPALLLLGGPEDRPGSVRPRTLAALDAAARRLAGPVQAAAAAERLTHLDADVRRLSALASLGELLSEIVHEIRNPLVSVKTFLQLLPDRVDDPEFRTHFLEVVSEEVRRVERLLDGVLQQARPESEAAGAGRAPAGPTLEAVARLLSHRAHEHGVRLFHEAGDDVVVPIHADALQQVVLNLAMNAVDATPEGGAVRLVAARGERTVEIACEDQGPGIPRELRARIFEPFFSTKSERPGGLGLAIARRMVVESGGTIRVEDRPGGGTRIVLAWRGGRSSVP